MCTSDARLKENVTNLGDDTLQKVLNLRPVTYNWNETSGHDQAQEHTGLIAQEVQTQFTDSVGVIYTDPVLGDVYGVDYASLVVPTIKALQELNAKVDLNKLLTDSALTVNEQQNDDSMVAIDDLTSRVEALETNQNSNQGTGNGGLDMEVSGMLFANGGLKVDGPSEFMGDAIFNSLVSFIGPSEFTGDANFAGRATFNSDSGGFAVIQTGKQEVKIVFDRPYAEAPVVTLTNKNGQFVDYAYKDLTKDGFTIILKDPATSDVEMSWTALSVKNTKVTVSP